MSGKQTEAQRLADALAARYPLSNDVEAAASELRRLDAELRRLNLYAAGADQLAEDWKGRAQEFMNSRDRLMNANRHLWARLDRLRAELSQPALCGQWICEYPGDVFVVFDPMTDGARIVGAARTLREAGKMLEAQSARKPQPAQQPMTDEQILEKVACATLAERSMFLRFARAIERAHGIK